MADHNPTLAECQAAVDAARAEFKACWIDLEASIAEVARHPDAAAAALYDNADEYGAESAVEALEQDLPQPGDAVPDGSAKISIAQREKLVAQLDALLDARDATDMASRSLNDVRAQAGQERIVHIGDRPYAIDTGTMSARSVDGHGDTFTLDVAHAPQPTPTLSEQARAIEQVEKAVAAPEHTRTRSR